MTDDEKQILERVAAAMDRAAGTFAAVAAYVACCLGLPRWTLGLPKNSPNNMPVQSLLWGARRTPLRMRN
jgi:hypothetical protein